MTAGGDLESAAAVFAGVRPRWQTCDRSVVTTPGAYLATTITRLAINAGQTARARHETYAGPWLPEPVDTAADPQLGAERGVALEFAVLLVLEKLSPATRTGGSPRSCRPPRFRRASWSAVPASTWPPDAGERA